MTAPTPKRMRALADAAANLTVDNDWDATVLADVMTTLRAAADTIELVVQQRDALAEVAGIEPEWTEADA